MEGLYFHCSLSVCLSVCVCVCPMFSCEQNSSRMDAPIWTQFSLNGSYSTGSNPIEIGDLGSKVTVAQNPFFLHNSLLTYLLYIWTLVCLIHLKFDMPFWYAHCRFVCEFHKNQTWDDVMVTSFKFSLFNCQYFKYY